jgi:hypothetical protein
MYVTINQHNMAGVEGIAAVLRGASTKYVIDLIFDSIVQQWGLTIPHIPKNTASHKIRLAGRHLQYIEQYASSKHISITVAVNLILLDYFSDQVGTKKSVVAQITPNQTVIEPSHPTAPKEPTRKRPGGEALLQGLKKLNQNEQPNTTTTNTNCLEPQN